MKLIKNTYTQKEVNDLLDRNTSQVTAQVLNKFKDTYNKKEVREILIRFAPFARYDAEEGKWTHIVDKWIKENL